MTTPNEPETKRRARHDEAAAGASERATSNNIASFLPSFLVSQPVDKHMTPLTMPIQHGPRAPTPRHSSKLSKSYYVPARRSMSRIAATSIIGARGEATVGEIHHHMGVLHAIPHCDRVLHNVSLVLLHPGIGHQRHRTTWQQFLSLLSRLPNAPVVAVTSLNAADQQRDLAELPGCVLDPPLKWHFTTIELQSVRESQRWVRCNERSEPS